MYSISEVNGVKIYNLSAGKSLPEFYQEARKTHKSLKYNQQFRRRIELIQDFQFQSATNQVQMTEDQRYIITTGTYGPQLKIFDTSELSMKCLRGLDSEAVKFVMLSTDYSKIAIAGIDRSISFHAQYGNHFKTRIPHFPRDITYNPFNCNLLVSASANEIYRMTLQEGKFLQSFQTDSFINSLNYNKYLNILYAGGKGLQVWDFRERKKINKIQSDQIFTVKSDTTGLLVAVGQTGIVDLFDVRFDRRISRIKHAYNQPINSIQFNSETKQILSSTKKQIKITNQEGKLFTSVEPTSNINMFSLVKESGLIMAAHQDPKIGCYFIPELGPSPKWVPYLQNVTEQLEQNQNTVVYDEFKFVTEQEVYELQCTNLIGTNILKPYLHGYLIHLKLYNKLKNKISQSYQQYRKKGVQQQIQKELPKRIQFQAKTEDDDRFKKMKQDSNFAINKYSQEYILRHPNLKKQLLKQKDIMQEKLQRSLKIKKKRK